MGLLTVKLLLTRLRGTFRRKFMNRMQILANNFDLEFLIGAVRKPKKVAASGESTDPDIEPSGYELVFRWDNEMLARKLKTKMLEVFHNDVSMKKKEEMRNSLDVFFKMQESALYELIGEFNEEVRTTKITL